MDLLLFAVWPVLLTLLVCTLAGWLLPRVPVWVGLGSGLLMGIANMWVGVWGIRVALSLDLQGHEFGIVMVGSTIAILIGSLIPITGMWLFGRLRLAKG